MIKIKRTKGLRIFDLDDSVSKSVTTISQYHLTSEGIFPVEVRKYGNWFENSLFTKFALQGN